MNGALTHDKALHLARRRWCRERPDRFDQIEMALALLERTNRRYHEVSVGYVERAARIGAFLGCWRPKPLAIDSAMNNRDALSIDARGRQRIGDASGDCDHAIDRAIEQIRREHAIGPVVHPPRH